jgi:NAD(P)-dependent dehydrogenase (short-subunit alcohol dehydrogenase family)
MHESLKGKVVLITGANGGIGLASAEALAREGASLMLSDLDEKRGRELVESFVARGTPAEFKACNVTDATAVEALIAATVERFGRIDGAVNNAGIEHAHQRLADHSDDDFDLVVAVNLKGVYLCMKHELRQMLKQGGGTIVNIASLAGLGGAPQLGGYVASKHGVVGLTKTAALEYARKNIRVNAVCPSFTNTEMVKRMIQKRPEVKPSLESASPMKRMGEPEEMANVVVFLCSDASSFVNGQCHAVDGGMTAM